MLIAYNRVFLQRAVLERTPGRMRRRELLPGRWVRMVKRLGRGLYLVEPCKAPRRTARERFLAGEPVTVAELLADPGPPFRNTPLTPYGPWNCRCTLPCPKQLPCPRTLPGT